MRFYGDFLWLPLRRARSLEQIRLHRKPRIASMRKVPAVSMDLTASGVSQQRSNNGPLRLGVIGCGWVTEARHLPALQRLRGAEIVALSDVDPGRLSKLADLFRIKRRYPLYEQLLADEAVAAVAVCVPAQFHVEVASAALDAGKHVFIEKPLARSR
jgi:Oxidoreductase family, NAD-binding Rossmann fold